MTDIFQYRRVVELEYLLGQGQIHINMDGTDDTYYSKLDEVKIDPKMTYFKNLKICKNVVKMQFSTPIICNIQSGRNFSSMTCGVNFEGKNKAILVEKLEGLADKFSPMWEESIREIKEGKKTKNSDDDM